MEEEWLWERGELGQTAKNEMRRNCGWDMLYEGRKILKKKKGCLLPPKHYVYSHVMSL